MTAIEKEHLENEFEMSYDSSVISFDGQKNREISHISGFVCLFDISKFH